MRKLEEEEEEKEAEPATDQKIELTELVSDLR